MFGKILNILVNSESCSSDVNCGCRAAGHTSSKAHNQGAQPAQPTVHLRRNYVGQPHTASHISLLLYLVSHFLMIRSADTF